MFGQDKSQATNGDGGSATFGAGDSTAPSLPPLDGAQAFSAVADGPADTAAPAPVAAPPLPTVSSEDLVSIKQEALQALTPLVGHLDQTPEEKFRTTMMMIQAADDQTLIRTAYDAAKQIPDEKVRAQALLDIVNEINYFTQHNK